MCSYRKKNTVNETKMYVKVSMDGAPFLRKIDLAMHKGYSELVLALEKFFGCYGIRKLLHFLFLSFYFDHILYITSKLISYIFKV